MAPRSVLDRLTAAVPEDLAAARRVARSVGTIDDATVDDLLWSEAHGLRLVAVLALVQRFRAGDDATRAAVLERWLDAARAERLDSRELVDLGAEQIVGEWYVDRPRNAMFALAKSDVVWVRRAAVMATLSFVKRGDASTSLDIAGRLVRERGDDVQTAVGLVLREVGKRADHDALLAFLDRYATMMRPATRTAAIEHLGPVERERYAI
ncbi:DNA alkylation repair protein [Curtobacterium sp. Leaf261]|uniref:DNA alkylation repair protein n=1 Tax=Curtobacterium sp. Leaf261 TaxID=1736311 RepID=UPI00138F2BC1|nr:DNA alkylation repair protein [Curtobacterium sp. Leaf261]